MTPLFFLFDISPLTCFLVVAFWLIVFLVAGIKDAGKKGWEKKTSDKWTRKDWQEYNRHVQQTLDDYNRWKRDYLRSKGVDPDAE